MSANVPVWLARAVAEGRVKFSGGSIVKSLPKARPAEDKAECIRPLLRELGLEIHFVREYPWLESRRGHPRRFDWCYPEMRVAIEIQGGVHRIKAQHQRDMKRMNDAVSRGWLVLQFRPWSINNEPDVVKDSITRALTAQGISRGLLATEAK